MKKESNNIVGLVITVTIIVVLSILVGSLLRKPFEPKVQTETFNGFEFNKIGNFWYTAIRNPILNEEYEVDFRYSPSEVRDIPVIGDPNQFFKLLELNQLNAAYFTFNPLDNLTYMSLVSADLAKLLKTINGVTLIPACTLNETEPCQKRQILTCQSQEGKSVVIYAKHSNTTSITMEKNCLTLQGSGEDLLRAKDKLFFIWYGIL
jgi:hypothetical protein